MQPSARERCKCTIAAASALLNQSQILLCFYCAAGCFYACAQVRALAKPVTVGSCAVARIALVKPEKARGVESMVLQMAQRGALTERVSTEHHAANPGSLPGLQVIILTSQMASLIL